MENWDEKATSVVSLVRFTNGFVAAQQIALHGFA
jgi:hypothetical protein